MRTIPLTETEWRRARLYFASRRIAGKRFDKKLMRDLQAAIENVGERDVQGLSNGLSRCVLDAVGYVVDNGIVVYRRTAFRS